MLTSILIRNLAVIDAAEIELEPGLTVLTGETGAGKSILVDALALALGARSDSKAVRAGADRCEVTASYRLQQADPLRSWLAEHDLDDEDECLIRRIAGADGRSRGYVNGRPVTMQILQELGEQLLDICGQQAHQRLRHRAVQRELLDQFGGHEKLVAGVVDAHGGWRKAQEEFERLRTNRDQAAARQELLEFQLRELTALGLQPGETAELEQELARLSNSGRIETAVRGALAAIYEADDGAAQDIVARARQPLEDLAEISPSLAAIAALLGETETLLGEAAESLRQQLATLEHDPAREDQLGDRLAEARTLARKHRCKPDELPALGARLVTELAELEGSDERLAELDRQVEELAIAARASASALSQARQAAAQKLSLAVTANMQELGMPAGRFEIVLTPLTEPVPGPRGAETVEFQVAANPGQPAGPIARVASGGELSRISLALQVAAARGASLGTLVFDEVDAGVGGGVAEMVGARLHELSAGRQVLCVTHLPQVASQADHHLRVMKMTDGTATRTHVRVLSPDERVEEIARMLGGVKITKRTRDHAREMLETGARRAG